MKSVWVAAGLVASSSLTAQSATVTKAYSYFSIGGNNLEEIEKELGRRGPKIKNSEGRHPGATRMEFISKIGYAEKKGGCAIANAHITVKATLILPRWKARKRSNDETRLIWDTLSADIKRHEESHVSIAKTHAHELETAIRKLHTYKSCKQAQDAVQQVTKTVLAKHDREQARFDKIEGLNFERRLMRLLSYRLERM